ncbi:hypothetical protein D9M71_662310 [compost metagenome]
MTVDDHCYLAVQLAVAQAALDLFRFDAKAANFHLVVPAATQLDATLCPLRHVTGAIDTQGLAIREGQVQIAFGSLLRVVQVAQTYARTCDVQLADGLLDHRLQIVIENQHLSIGDRTTQSPIIVAGLHLPGGDQHRGLCGAIEVVQVALARQLLDDPRFADIAPGHYVIEGLQRLQRQDA